MIDQSTKAAACSVYIIIWAHFVADFICQTDAMARNKSSSNFWLGYHISTYTLALMVGALAVTGGDPRGVAIYALVNGAAHFATDYVTSRITKRLWEKKRVHDFFVVIGFDQALHMTILLATLPILGGAQ